MGSNINNNNASLQQTEQHQYCSKYHVTLVHSVKSFQNTLVKSKSKFYRYLIFQQKAITELGNSTDNIIELYYVFIRQVDFMYISSYVRKLAIIRFRKSPINLVPLLRHTFINKDLLSTLIQELNHTGTLRIYFFRFIQHTLTLTHDSKTPCQKTFFFY